MKKIDLTKDLKISALNEIKKYFSAERDENLGDLSAELFLDFITEKIAPFFYNQGIRDSHQFMSERLEDLYGLEKTTNI